MQLSKDIKMKKALTIRIYDLGKLKATGTKLPKTSLEDGIKNHLISLGYVK